MQIHHALSDEHDAEIQRVAGLHLYGDYEMVSGILARSGTQSSDTYLLDSAVYGPMVSHKMTQTY
jgi:hypothetical protein